MLGFCKAESELSISFVFKLFLLLIEPFKEAVVETRQSVLCLFCSDSPPKQWLGSIIIFKQRS